MGGKLTTLGRAKVLARSRGAGANATCLLDVKGAALNDFAAQAFYGGVGHVGSDHLDKAKATRLAGVGILHDLALLDLAVLLKETGDLRLLETRVDAGDEEVRAGVDGALIILVAVVILDGRAVVGISGEVVKAVGCRLDSDWCDVPIVSVRGHGPTARVVAIVATRRRTTVAVVAGAVIWSCVAIISKTGDGYWQRVHAASAQPTTAMKQRVRLPS